jgi:FMN phosphatase YigB (HAD superfamily)
LFVDDQPENVEAAARLGMRAIRFVDPDRLRSDLRDLDLLPAGA